MEKLLKQIGGKIREIRKAQGMTLEDLANKTDLDWSFVARIETGKAAPSLKSLFSIAKSLNITINDLFVQGAPSQDKLIDRELTSLFANIKPADRLRILRNIKLLLSKPLGNLKISKQK